MSETSTAPVTHAGAPQETAAEHRPQAYLLHLLAAAPSRSLKQGELNKRLKTKAAEQTGTGPSVATDQLQRLATAGLVRIAQTKRAVVYELTDAGAARLDGLKDLLPPTRPVGGRGKIVPPSNEQVRGYRTGYLLLQVLRSPRQSVTEADANAQLDAYARETLELNAATASHLRQELVGQGRLARSGSGRGASYTLTPAGRLALGNAAFPPDRTFPVGGRLLNDLLEAAREVGKQFAAVPAAPPAATDIEAAILAAFEELLRERHGATGLVPISEVRAAVRRRLGEAAGRHESFDEEVLGLWRAKRVRLTPIADHGKATPEELRDAIPGLGETLFYLEPAGEPAPV
jgi:predicted transcriptional regulator